MELSIFKSSRFGQIRAFKSENGEPLFVAVDVAKALGYENPSKAIATHCKSGDITNRYVAHENGIGGTNLQIIKEANLYRLIMKSKLKEAEFFQDWVFEDVLPAIRQTGGYISTNEADTPEMIMAKALQVAASTIENSKQKIKQLEVQTQIQTEEIIKMKPLSDLAKECYQSTNTMTASIISARLGFKSPASFNKSLKEMGVQYKIKGDECWKLTSKYSCKEYTKTIPFPYPKQDGTIGTRNQMEWTEAGFVFLKELLNKKASA